MTVTRRDLGRLFAFILLLILLLFFWWVPAWAADRYWVGGTGTWDASATTHWSATDGGASGASAPTSTDNVFFTANSNVGTGAFTVTTSGSPLAADFTASGLDGAMTLTMSAALSIAGNFDIPASNFAFSQTSALTFTATSPKTITTHGVSITCDITFNGAGGTWTLQDNLTHTRNPTLTAGTVALNGFTFTGLSFNSNNSNARGLDFTGGGKISLTANNATVWNVATATNLTITGTPTVELTYTGSTLTRAISHGNTAGGTEANSVNFAITGGTDGLLFTGGGVVRSLNFTGYAGAVASSAFTIYGDVTLGSGMTLTGGANAWTFGATSGTKLITANGVSAANAWTFNGAGGTWQFQDAFTNTTTLTQTNGTIDLNGKTVTFGAYATATGTKNLTFNNGTLAVSGSGATAFNNAAPTNFTTSKGSVSTCGTISMTSASAKTFVGGGSTYQATLNEGGAGILTITGSNTFCDLSATTAGTTIKFTAGTTTTFSVGFHLQGTNGNNVTIDSVTAAQHTLSLTTGLVNTNYLTIAHSNAGGGALWYAPVGQGNTDGGNNTGWHFTAAPLGGNLMLLNISKAEPANDNQEAPSLPAAA